MMRATLRFPSSAQSGYTGGELLRLLLDHPHVVVQQVTSERNAGNFVHFTHPNLRGRTKLQFVSVNELEPADLLFLCLPHGSAMSKIEHFAGLAAAHRRSERRFPAARTPTTTCAGTASRTANPAWLAEVRLWPARAAPRGTRRVRTMSAASAATPPPPTWRSARCLRSKLVDESRGVICEVKVGSSEGGNASSDSDAPPGARRRHAQLCADRAIATRRRSCRRWRGWAAPGRCT